jgi:hypothetical protein
VGSGQSAPNTSFSVSSIGELVLVSNGLTAAVGASGPERELGAGLGSVLAAAGIAGFVRPVQHRYALKRPHALLSPADAFTAADEPAALPLFVELLLVGMLDLPSVRWNRWSVCDASVLHTPARSASCFTPLYRPQPKSKVHDS